MASTARAPCAELLDRARPSPPTGPPTSGSGALPATAAWALGPRGAPPHGCLGTPWRWNLAAHPSVLLSTRKSWGKGRWVPCFCLWLAEGRGVTDGGCRADLQERAEACRRHAPDQVDVVVETSAETPRRHLVQPQHGLVGVGHPVKQSTRQLRPWEPRHLQTLTQRTVALQPLAVVSPSTTPPQSLTEVPGAEQEATDKDQRPSPPAGHRGTRPATCSERPQVRSRHPRPALRGRGHGTQHLLHSVS